MSFAGFDSYRCNVVVFGIVVAPATGVVLHVLSVCLQLVQMTYYDHWA